jgi:hypothetical protein
MLIVIALVVVGAMGGKLLARRYPVPAREQLFAATASLSGAILSMAGGSNGPGWYYTNASIAVVMAAFLLMVWLRPRRTPPTAS